MRNSLNETTIEKRITYRTIDRIQAVPPSPRVPSTSGKKQYDLRFNYTTLVGQAVEFDGSFLITVKRCNQPCNQSCNQPCLQVRRCWRRQVNVHRGRGIRQRISTRCSGLLDVLNDMDAKLDEIQKVCCHAKVKIRMETANQISCISVGFQRI